MLRVDYFINFVIIKRMNIVVAVLALIVGVYVGKSVETMTPEKMETIERNKNESSK